MLSQVSEVQKKKRRTAAKSNNRSIVGASLEVIQKKRTEKPEVRQASREAAIREVKVRAAPQAVWPSAQPSASAPRALFAGDVFQQGS
jgi:large subunit ribosomal protein L24e